MNDLKMTTDSIKILENEECSIDELNSKISAAILSILPDFRKSARINITYRSVGEDIDSILEILYDRLEYPYERDSRLRAERFYEEREKAQYEHLRIKFEGASE